MNRVCLTALCAALILTLSLAPATQSAAAEPLAVVSLSAQNGAVGEIGDLSALADAPDMPAWLAAMFKLYAEGQGAYGLDNSRPWGVVFQVDSTVSGYCFVPITDAEGLAQTLGDFIESIDHVDGNIYSVVGKQPNQQIYVTVVGQWLFASDSRWSLTGLPADPTKLLCGLNKQFDVAFRANVSAIPESVRPEVNEKLNGLLGMLVSQVGSERTMAALSSVMDSIDSITMGWRAHK